MSEITNSPYDLIVIGAGPGGYVAAIRAAQLGMRVACIDRQFLGGTCLNIGCIPSKALLDSSERLWEAKNKLSHHGIQVGNVTIDLKTMLGRKDQVVKQLTDGVGFLFKKNKVDSVIGQGRVVSPDTVEVKTADGTSTIKAKRILIATGSAPIELPGIPFDGTHVVGSTEALAFDKVPERLLVVGAGYIGLELGSVWARLGSKVHFLEFTDTVLPLMDRDLSGRLQRILEKQGLTFQFATSAQETKIKDGKVHIAWKSGDKTGTEIADKVLVATGRRPVIDGLGLKEAGVELDKRGFVKIDAHFQTNVPGIYAIGDVVGGLMLAHKAEDEGIAAAEIMADKPGHVNYRVIPGVVYTHPELAQVGLTEADAQREGREVRVGKFLLSANGRAKSMDETEGMVKVIGDAKTDRLLGVQILAAHASDMIAECVVAMELGASVEDIARSSHAHPTLPEAIKEAALAVDKRAIHS
ncbi:MAG TPA: dihydrolipoyl dehydrogenase [Tepidisphaeraceae bacterium]|jgi:dihydrolipoamide dehydrogenase|nr:dihydrolipoyl dehydrogenase [Tepidisphaeraceae bacterium]